MERFGLIGSGISHSGSPALFSDYCGGKYPYDLIDCRTFAEAWRIFSEGPYRAVNVTSPFKTEAASAADSCSDAVRSIGAANILVKDARGLVRAYNSDYLAVRDILGAIPGTPALSVTVVGGGGAGRAALCAAESLGMTSQLIHHQEYAIRTLSCDILIYTLPCAVPGAPAPGCKVLIESNYADPCFDEASLGGKGIRYVSGLEWLRAQAESGYPLMLRRLPVAER